MRTTQVSLAWSTVYAVSTTLVFFPTGEWRSAAGQANARSNGEMRGRSGLIEATPALQFSNFEDGTGAAVVAVGTAMAADGFTPPAAAYTSVTPQSTQYRLMRAGFYVRLTSGSTTGFARVGGLIEIVAA